MKMRRILLILGILVCLTVVQVVFGQISEGVIHYETKISLHRNLPPERQDMKAMIPEFRTTKDQLFFNSGESIYKPIIEDEPEEMNAGGMRMRFNAAQSETYINTDSEQRIVSQEFMGKKYQIEDTLKMSPWKFGNETKTILGYVCRQAYYTDEVQMMGPQQQKRTQEITAWYTDQLRPMLGPERFGTLPGAVLAVDINNGERVIVATKVENRVLKKNELKAPAVGTKVTREEFQKMVAKQMERMRANGGNVIIRN
jgi:GLPGLI family protein